MCKRILRTFVNTEIYGLRAIDIPCDEVRENEKLFLYNYRIVNSTDKLTEKGLIDRNYEKFKENMEQFLAECEDDIKLECDKCKKEEHEGYFCRCEARNIALARKLRNKGKSPWSKKTS